MKTFDEKGIRENIYVHGANNRTKNTPVSLVESMELQSSKRLIAKGRKETM